MREQEERKETKSKEFYRLFCKRGPITATVNLDHGGYVPGDSIGIAVDVDNKSNVNIKEIEVVTLRKPSKNFYIAA